jgi:hypothetical protein
MLRRVWLTLGEKLCLFVTGIQFNAVTTITESQPKDSHRLDNLKFYFGKRKKKSVRTAMLTDQDSKPRSSEREAVIFNQDIHVTHVLI